nr:olfactory receptor 155 [Microplitis mediator]
MNLSVEEKFEEVKLLIDNIAGFINILGGWPIEPTLKRQILFYIYLVYHIVYLSMGYNDLFEIIGNLDLITGNLTTTAMQTIVLVRMLYVQFSKNIFQIIMSVKVGILEKNDYSQSEKEIFLSYYPLARKYHKVTIVFAFVAGFSWCALPLQNYFISLLLNRPAILIAPYRVKIFFLNATSFKSTVVIYILETPLPVPPICYVAIVNLQVVLVIYICAHMAILSQRISNFRLENKSSYRKFCHLINAHLEMIKLAQNIENTWTPIYLFEMLVLTPIVALVMYYGLLAFDAGEKVAFISLCTYVCAAMSCLFANCLMGEMLKTECERLFDAYYHCNWYDMPISDRGVVLTCMTYTKNPLTITAGKVYTFSFNAFAGIVKSSLAYVSILRTLLV